MVSFPTWLALWLIPLFFFEALYMAMGFKSQRKISYKEMALRFVQGVIVIGLALSPLYYEFSNWPESVVVTFDGDKVIKHPWGTFCWSKCSNLTTGGSYVVGEVTSLTGNPKVRKLSYRLVAQVVDPEKFYSDARSRTIRLASWEESSERTGKITGFGILGNPRTTIQLKQQLVLYYAFQFNNEHSKELAGFYNPMDSAENSTLKLMLESYLNERLEKNGIAVRFDGFTVE